MSGHGVGDLRRHGRLQQPFDSANAGAQPRAGCESVLRSMPGLRGLGQYRDVAQGQDRLAMAD